MKLSISNIAWTEQEDDTVYNLMIKHGFSGLEIAPTRIIKEKPYENIEMIKEWYQGIHQERGLNVPSMQSIWFGKQEKIFGTSQERSALIEYTKKAIDFATVIQCRNLVFGCPRNRSVPDGIEHESIALEFFHEISDYAYERGTVIGMEANPVIYNTNYINDTESALCLIKKVNSNGFKLNLDMGTMIYNNEDVGILKGNVKYINHIHISEPGLIPIKERDIHKDLFRILEDEKYTGYISIEMATTEDIFVLDQIMKYVSEIFC